ncbi:MAG: DMT family transporter [Flavobacteriales bacterium]|nr:DMT family transporter [Flavobacteriales bacterium]
MENSSDNRRLAWFLLVLLSVVWGASYILIRFSLFDGDGNQRLKPDQLGAVRMVVASLVLLPFFVKYWRNIQKKHIPFILIAGLCGNGIPAYLYAYAQTHLESAITGMLNSFVPIFAISISALVFGFKIKWNHLAGVVLGIVGAYVLVYSKLKDVQLTQDEIIPFALVIVATLCYAISLNVIKYKLTELRPITITSAAFLSVGLPSLIYLLSTDIVGQLSSQENILDGIWVVTLLAVFGTAGAVYLFNHLIQISSPIFASSVTYFIPVVATMFGVIFNEEVNAYQFVGMSILISGVLLINKQFSKK